MLLRVKCVLKDQRVNKIYWLALWLNTEKGCVDIDIRFVSFTFFRFSYRFYFSYILETVKNEHFSFEYTSSIFFFLVGINKIFVFKEKLVC